MPGPDAARAAMRSRKEIEAVRDRLQGELEEIIEAGLYGEAYTRAKIAALNWVLGWAEISPLSGQTGVDVSNPWALIREQIQATEMLQGLRPRDRRGEGYISGVEHALMWVLGETDSSL